MSPLPPVRQVPAAALFKRSHDADRVWCRGPEPDPQVLRVAVVGSRGATVGQLEAAKALGRQLTELGVCVASGGALGVDAAALRGGLEVCLDSDGTLPPPLAILPGGLHRPFPRQNIPLFDRIVGVGGALVSLIEEDGGHVRGRFHTRNDLLCALVDAVIVVCGDHPSGTLHCAGRAWKREMPVLAVPWSQGTPRATGSNLLLASGARAVTPGPLLEAWVASLKTQPPPAIQPSLGLADSRPRWGPMQESGAQKIDGSPAPWPCYASRAEPPPQGHGDPPDVAPELLALLREVLVQAGPAGLTADEAGEAIHASRAAVGAALLAWTLHGGVRRIHGSWYALE